jgi:hypothetical protein
MRRAGVLAFVSAAALAVSAPAGPQAQAPEAYLLRPQRVFDASTGATNEGLAVLVRGTRIEAVGPAATIAVPAGTETIDLPGATLLPGLIDAHAHVLLHPYDEAPWIDQVLKEPESLRVVRAVNHLRATLEAGFTTLRDLGTEGAGYADAGLKQAVDQGIVMGPRLLISSRAIVATGTYAPKGFSPEWTIPQGAEEADGDALIRVVRDQAGRGAAPTGSRCTPTTAPARRGRRPRRSPKRSCGSSSRRRGASAGRWRRTPARPRACAVPSRPASRRSTTATAARTRSFG